MSTFTFVIGVLIVGLVLSAVAESWGDVRLRRGGEG